MHVPELYLKPIFVHSIVIIFFSQQTPNNLFQQVNINDHIKSMYT